MAERDVGLGFNFPQFPSPPKTTTNKHLFKYKHNTLHLNVAAGYILWTCPSPIFGVRDPAVEAITLLDTLWGTHAALLFYLSLLTSRISILIFKIYFQTKLKGMDQKTAIENMTLYREQLRNL